MSVQKEGIEQHIIVYFQLYPDGGPGIACGFVSQDTSVFRELWDHSLFYKWEQGGIKVWFAFSHLSAFMAV